MTDFYLKKSMDVFRNTKAHSQASLNKTTNNWNIPGGGAHMSLEQESVLMTSHTSCLNMQTGGSGGFDCSGKSATFLTDRPSRPEFVGELVLFPADMRSLIALCMFTCVYF